MSLATAPRSRVVLHAGGASAMSAADRATLTRLLLERGLEVTCTRESAAPAGGEVDAIPRVTVPPAQPAGAQVVDIAAMNASHADPGTLAAAIEREAAVPREPSPVRGGAPAAWKPWFPVIDYSRCTNCMQCLSFCLFDVYGVSSESKIQVQNQSNCKTDCPACSRVCPEVAIMFPKYRHGPINGEEVKGDDVRREAMKVDISALLGGDVYALLRDRSVKAKSRFSKERDDDRALKERQNCLIALQRDLAVPPEVLAALPSPQEIIAKAEAARLRAEQARAAFTAVNPAPTSGASAERED